MKIVFLLFLLCLPLTGQSAESRLNIILLVGEDLGPDLGCYGDSYARTPNLDRFAAEGTRFTRAFTHAPVCAPSRSGLITGRYPTSIGTHHMRSKLLAPPPPWTVELRKAGYFVAWPGKTDFNFDPPREAFDSKADWVQQLPRQPFFAYHNFNDSHESSIRMAEKFKKATASLTTSERHDPAKATLPPYYPDTPEVRRDWANYYDLVTAVDKQAGAVLEKLEKSGLASNTVVFFFGDHGRGLPRAKRWIYDSGIRVPLLVRWPGQLKTNSVREDLVSFVDFGPTVLSLAGAPIPRELQGQVFLGHKRAPERKYIYAARDRMDEAPDRIRCVRDARFKYIRNFQPDLPYAQTISYMEMMPTMKIWRQWNEQGKLTGPQRHFFAATKPREELYDLQADPHEVRNLIQVREHYAKVKELREAMDRWMVETKDLGAVPEESLIQQGLVKDLLSDYAKRKEPGYQSP